MTTRRSRSARPPFAPPRSPPPPSAIATTRCVGPSSGCQRTIQGALDARTTETRSRSRLARSRAPITITKTVRLTGAGAGATVIRGGGPVVTVGTVGAASEPTVTIAGVKITGGRTSTSFGEAFLAFGGGVFVPPGAGADPRGDPDDPRQRHQRQPGDPGRDPHPRRPATRTRPRARTALLVRRGERRGDRQPRDADARAQRRRRNKAGGPVASDAVGAGIWSDRGTLTIADSTIAA